MGYQRANKGASGGVQVGCPRSLLRLPRWPSCEKGLQNQGWRNFSENVPWAPPNTPKRAPEANQSKAKRNPRTLRTPKRTEASCVCGQDICCVCRQDICCVSRQDICCVIVSADISQDIPPNIPHLHTQQMSCLHTHFPHILPHPAQNGFRP